MTRRTSAFVTVIGAVVLVVGTSCGAPPATSDAATASGAPAPDTAPAQAPPAASVKDVMSRFTIPASDAVFNAGTEAPTTDAEWTALDTHAGTLVDSARLLMEPARARDQAAWMTAAQAQLQAAVSVRNAARTRNAEALATASDGLYETCERCHAQYMKQ